MLKNRASGFTLLEVTVALAIAGVGLAMLTAIAATGLGNSTTANHYVEATRIAQSHLAAAGAAIPLATGEQSGDEGGYAWRLSISPPLVQSSPDKQSDRAFGLYTLDVTVTWRDGFAPRSVQLRSRHAARVAADELK